ncbi:MAG: hypothetical protein MUF45_00455 [Spirosomaceae bacterium]|jgi:hypothetical protein|nr:hypothetical protein [Spirosomataceae bacterium]
MVAIEEIKRRIKEGKRKWAKPLLQFVHVKLVEGYTYEAVSEWLLKEYDIDVPAKKLIDLKSKHNKYKPKKGKHLLTSQTFPRYKETINEKTEIESKEKIVPNQDNPKTDIPKYDFRTPTPKPSYVNWLKKDEKKNDEKKDDEKEDIESFYDSLFGDENILEKQKREKERLFQTNSKGAKW